VQTGKADALPTPAMGFPVSGYCLVDWQYSFLTKIVGRERRFIDQKAITRQTLTITITIHRTLLY
jgi:hypothetical protein